jgi:glucans biosynthesis protein C
MYVPLVPPRVCFIDKCDDAQQEAAPIVQPSDRLHALDAVRAFALLLGIFLHATMPFLAGLKGWATTESPSETMATVWFVIHMFRMPVFFLIAGFFGRLLLERRGTRAFVRDRLKRIVLPLIVGLPVVIILTVVMYVLGALLVGVDLQDLQARAQAENASSAEGSEFSLAHLWFLYYLAMFYAAALLLRLPRNDRTQAAIDSAVRFLMSGPWGAVLLALPLTAYFYSLDSWSSWTGLPAPFEIVPRPGALLGYGMLFGFGWLLHRQPKLMLALDRSWPLYLAIAVVLTGACLSIGGQTPHWEPYLESRDLLLYTSAYMLGTWCWVFALIGAAVRFLSDVSPVRRYLADSSYWLYLMHIPVLIFFNALLDPLDWHWSAKYLLSIAGTVPALLLSYHYLVRFTWIGATLNGKRHPRSGATPVPA